MKANHKVIPRSRGWETDTTLEEGGSILYHEGCGYQEVWKSGSVGTNLPSIPASSLISFSAHVVNGNNLRKKLLFFPSFHRWGNSAKSPVDWSQTLQPAMPGLGYETRRSNGGALSSFSDLLSHLSPFGPRRTPGRACLRMT